MNSRNILRIWPFEVAQSGVAVSSRVRAEEGQFDPGAADMSATWEDKSLSSGLGGYPGEEYS